MRRTHIALGAALVAGALVGGGLVVAASAQAAVPVSTFADLQSAVTTGGTVTLGADITATAGQSLNVPLNTPVTLDLAGHSLSITSPDQPNPAVSVPRNASLTITDTGGTGSLTAHGGVNGAGIGGGLNVAVGEVTVSGGTVIATGGSYSAGIGGGLNVAGGTVTVTGGTVIATGADDGAGIGGGYGGAGGTLSVTGGTVTAHGGGFYGAGIGGGYGGAGGTVTVTGGTVTAVGGYQSAGIGGGVNGAGGSVTVGAGASVTASDGGGGASAVGAGAGGSSSGSLSNDGTLTIPSGATLRIPSGVTVTNSGTLDLSGTVTGAGTVSNIGTIQRTASGSVEAGVTVTGRNYTLSFDVNGGTSAAPAPLQVFATSVSGAGLSLPADPTPPVGSSFVGWFTAAAGGTQVTVSTDLSALAGTGPSTLPLYAHYTISSYTVTFDAAGGAPQPADQRVDYGSPATRPATDPVKTGYTFTGWYTSAGDLFDFTAAITGDLSLTARYTINSYTVSFDAAGGTPQSADQSVDYGSAATRPADPTKTGYTFTGWYTAAGDLFDFGTGITADLTLTAHYSIDSYTVTFDAAGGTQTADQSVDYGSAATRPADPIKTGYTFTGWYTPAGNLFDFTTGITADLTLTAEYMQITLTVTDASGTPVPSGSALARGQHVTVTVTGLEPDTAYTLTARSAPIVLSRIHTDPHGAAAATVTIPSILAAGSHHLTVDTTTGTILASFAFTLPPVSTPTSTPTPPPTGTSTSLPAPASDASLAQTGTNLATPLTLAVLLLIAGLALIRTGRPRGRTKHRH